MRRFALIAALGLAGPAMAQQQLIPAPYPSGNDGARLLVAPPPAKQQYLVPTPYPHQLGPNALGNPPSQKIRRKQKLVPAPYPRHTR
jgi:hypothetical protein